MDKYDDATAVNGEFTDGDPLAVPPIPRTVLRSIWTNMIQRELINVVEGAGLTLDKNQFDQVFQAIKAMINAPTNETAPVGSLLIMAKQFISSAPPGYLVPQGQVLNRASYPELWDHAVADGPLVTDAQWNSGLTYKPSFSSGDGSTTFRLPDLRGLFWRVLGGPTWDTGRSGGTYQADDNKFHKHSGWLGANGSHQHSFNVYSDDGSGPFSDASTSAGGVDGTVTTTSAGFHTHTITIGWSGGDESRPVNFAFPVYMRYRTFS